MCSVSGAMSRFRYILRKRIISFLLFIFLTFLFFIFYYRWDVEEAIWSWILYMIIFSPIILFGFFLDPYFKLHPVGIPTMIGTVIISLLTFFLLSILIIGYEPWMNNVFPLITLLYCIRLVRYIYERRKHSTLSRSIE